MDEAAPLLVPVALAAVDPEAVAGAGLTAPLVCADWAVPDTGADAVPDAPDDDPELVDPPPAFDGPPVAPKPVDSPPPPL